jgi:transposase
MIELEGLLVLKLLSHVRQVTVEPHILAHVAAGSQVYTDEYNVYRRLVRWGYGHSTVQHNLGEYARDDDGDGFCEVHVNTIEGVWSLLRSWLRPHRGISQTYLGLYLASFEFLHNAQRRGKAVLHALVEALVARPRITS